MIILIYGTDSYRAGERLQELISAHKQKHVSGLNLRRFDAKNLSVEDLENEMFGMSMFKEKKLILIDNVFSATKFKELFLKKIERFIKDDNVLVFFENTAPGAKDKFVSALKEDGVKVELFEELGGAKLKNWANKEIEKTGAVASTGVIEKLIDYVGGDLWRMKNEIKKLSHFVLAKGKKEITSSDLEKILVPDLELNIFDTIDAIARKDKKQAINLFKKHLQEGAEVPYLLSMVAWQIRNIVIAKTASGYGSTGISPFVLRKASAQAKNFSLDDLKRIYQKIIDLDAALKVGKVLPESTLDLLILEI
jgi:DNA polymerase-3 subunit delta